MTYSKKRLFSTLLLCLTLLATGCSKHNQPDHNVTPTVTTPSPTVKPAESRPKILDNAIPAGEQEILSYIPNTAIEENLMGELAIFKDQLLSSCFIYDQESNTDVLHLRLLSLESGQIQHETRLPIAGSYTTVIQSLDNYIAVSDPQSRTICLFDETLKQVTSYTASGNIIYVSPDATEAYCLTDNDGIHVVNLETGEERILLEQSGDLTFYCHWENYICVRYIDLDSSGKKERYAEINLATGVVENKDSNPAYISMKLAGTPVHLITSTVDSEGASSMTAYDTDGTFLSSCSLKGVRGMLTEKLTWLSRANGFFFIIIDDKGYDKLYFWDLSKEMTGTDLDMTSFSKEEPATGMVLDESYYKRAQTLSKNYGITIQIADLCSTDYVDKTARQECDSARVSAGLDIVEKALSNYPDGFFRQLYYGAYRTVEINLMGEIANKEPIEGYSPSAFVQQENGKISVVLNINETPEVVESNFYHESSHIIDKVLEHDALYRSDALYSEETWCSLNPTEFTRLNTENNGYYGSYEMMPMEYYQEIFTSYFASDYGKTFSTEDRATIFETAITGNKKVFSPDVSKPLRSKLNYYCQCIRDCFDTTGWPEYTPWETALK